MPSRKKPISPLFQEWLQALSQSYPPTGRSPSLFTVILPLDFMLRSLFPFPPLYGNCQLPHVRCLDGLSVLSNLPILLIFLLEKNLFQVFFFFLCLSRKFHRPPFWCSSLFPLCADVFFGFCRFLIGCHCFPYCRFIQFILSPSLISFISLILW